MFLDDPDESEDDEQQDDGLGSDLTSEAWLAGIIAKHYEEAGLIPHTDAFSWEWHMLFNQSFADAPAPSQGQAEPAAPENSTAASVGGDFGPDFGSGFGGDFGGGFDGF
jgi:hypothetical protein